MQAGTRTRIQAEGWHAMTKRIFKIFLLFALALLAGFYAMTANAKGDSVPGPTQTAQLQPTQTEAARSCTVFTGLDGGTVNLRSCAGTSCAVVAIVTERERLTITTAGAWLKVTTEDGVTGFINSKYCIGK